MKGGANFARSLDAKPTASATVKQFQPMTPLTNRRYLPTAHQQSSPVTQHTQAVVKVRQLVIGYTGDIPAGLISLFATCETDPSRELRDVLTQSCDTFLASYSEDELAFAKSRLQIAKKVRN